MRRIWTIFRKEVIDNLRDRRSISSSLLTPVFMPIFLIALIMVVGRSVVNDVVEKPLRLPVVGREYAPYLIAFLEENNTQIIDAPADPRGAVREGQVNVVLVISPDFQEAMQAGQPAPLELVLDTSRQSASVDIQRARALLQSYSSQLAASRLQARGVNPLLIAPVAVATADVATPQSQAVLFLNMLPFLLIMTIFMGGMYVIIDTTAGERERGSLEPLLINPAFRWEFVLGKLLASLPFAVVSVALALVLFGLGFNLVPLEEYIGFKMSIEPAVLWNIFFLSLPMILLASALQMVVASFTRSFKEAQTYLSFLPLIAGLPGAFLAFLPVKPGLSTMLIPTFGQSILINQMLRGETIAVENIVISSLATLVVAVALVFVAMYLYQREQILFGR
jgi:sodium transport system permease protein